MDSEKICGLRDEVIGYINYVYPMSEYGVMENFCAIDLGIKMSNLIYMSAKLRAKASSGKLAKEESTAARKKSRDCISMAMECFEILIYEYFGCSDRGSIREFKGLLYEIWKAAA